MSVAKFARRLFLKVAAATLASDLFAPRQYLEVVRAPRSVVAHQLVAAPAIKVYATLRAIAAAQAVSVDPPAIAAPRVQVPATWCVPTVMSIAKAVVNLASALLVCHLTTLPTLFWAWAH